MALKDLYITNSSEAVLVNQKREYGAWSGVGHIDAVVTHDHRGLNNGAFFLRVHEWSVFLVVASKGTEIYDPTVQLQFDEQTAMEAWIHEDRFRDEVMHVPQRWFNAYAGGRGGRGQTPDPAKPLDKGEANSCKEGDLAVRHAGHQILREQRTSPWLNMSERHSPVWEVDLEDSTYPKEIKEFWEKEAPLEREKVDKMVLEMNERNAAYAAGKKQDAAKK
ncbi:hypothetical protein H2203_002122 [Taxawa tesnikishii (nom. ined.)]|nr:hypothetical protein H2203_002122 [Dothideales sp. JES 119]